MKESPKPSASPSGWRLLLGRALAVTSGEVDVDRFDNDAMAVERQAEESRAKGGIFAAVRAANLEQLNALLDARSEGASSSLCGIRGAVGEGLLHLCYLYNTPEHKRMARALLLRDPKLISSIYEGPTYYGENVLHMAVANKDEEEVRFLTKQCPSLIRGQAEGSFFQLGGSAYMGGLPLSFAVVANQAALVRYLVEECGADLSARDRYGNTPARESLRHPQHCCSRLRNQLIILQLCPSVDGTPCTHPIRRCLRHSQPTRNVRPADGIVG